MQFGHEKLAWILDIFRSVRVEGKTCVIITGYFSMHFGNILKRFLKQEVNSAMTKAVYSKLVVEKMHYFVSAFFWRKR